MTTTLTFRTRMALVEGRLGDCPNALICLHGAGQNASGLASLTRFSKLSNDITFIYPQGYENSWAIPDAQTPATIAKINDVAFIKEIVERFSSEFQTKRFGIVGVSEGGFMAQELAWKVGAFDFIATVAATDRVNRESLSYYRRFPFGTPRVIMFHGTADPQVPYAGGEITFTKKPYKVMGVEDLARSWAWLTGGEWTSTTEKIDKNPKDKMWVEKMESGLVTLYKCVGAGHTYPGVSKRLAATLFRPLLGPTCQDVDASEIIVDAFTTK